MSPLPPTLYPVSAPAADLALSDFGHAVRFYSDDLSFFDELTDFISGVLRSGEPVMAVVTQQHREMIRDLLAKKGLDSDPRSFLLLDTEATLERFMVNNAPDPMRFRDLVLRSLARARGGYGRNEERVTIFGEMVAVLWSQGNPEAALQLEELWNDLAQTQRFSLICAYPARLFEGSEHWDAFASVCGAHSSVLPDESYFALQSEEERLRVIAGLQLKARSLDKEVARHKEAESNLQGCIDERSAEVEQTRARLRDLCGQLLRLRDQESQRVAQELHDSTAQLLSVLAIYIDLLEGNKESFGPAAAQLVSRSNALVRQILLQVRSLSYGLYPPTLDLVGLGSALEWYCTRFSQRTGTPVTVEFSESMQRLPQSIEMAMFRFVQECLAKVQEYGSGVTVNIRVNRSPEGATLSLTAGTSGSLPADSGSSSPDVFGSVPGEIQERVRQLNGRVFTVSEASSSGVSVFFPGQPNGLQGGTIAADPVASSFWFSS